MKKEVKIKKGKTKQNNVGVTIIIILCLIILALAIIFGIFHKSLTGYFIIDNHPGYASPDGFNIGADNFIINNSLQTINLEVNVSKQGG